MTQFDQSTDDVDRIEELNRAWDLWNQQTADLLRRDDLTDLLAELQSIDDSPAPDPAFLATLRADLVTPVLAPSSLSMRRTSLGLVAMPSMRQPFPQITPIRIALAALAALLLVAALFGGNRWLPGSGSAVMVASAMASPVSRGEPTATTYPGLSFTSDPSESPSFGRASAGLVTYPTAIPSLPENTTSGVLNSHVVRTPAIVYSIE